MTLILRFFLSALLFLSGVQSWAGAPTPPTSKEEDSERDRSLDFLDSIEYPELQVVPRASERVDAEAAAEKDGGAWFNQWSLLLSGTSTYFAASSTSSAISNPRPDQTSAVQVGQALGALTLGTGIYFALQSPFSTASEKLHKQKVTTKRQLLMRERTADELMEKTAEQNRVASRFALVSNLVADSILASSGNQSSQSICYAAILIQLAGLVFPNPYVTAWDKQNEYKHKIYAPLPVTSLQKDPLSGATYPTVGMLWSW